MTADPLQSGPEQERALFQAFLQLARDRNVDAVLGAAVNIIVNAIRQMEPTRARAEFRFNGLFGQAKELLISRHYDSVTGKRRTIFPFTQQVVMPVHHEDDEARG